MESSGYMDVLEEQKSPPNPLIRQKYDQPFVVRQAEKLSPSEKKQIMVILKTMGPKEIDTISSAFGVDRSVVEKLRVDRKRKRAAPVRKKKTAAKG